MIKQKDIRTVFVLFLATLLLLGLHVQAFASSDVSIEFYDPNTTTTPTPTPTHTATATPNPTASPTTSPSNTPYIPPAVIVTIIQATPTPTPTLSIVVTDGPEGAVSSVNLGEGSMEIHMDDYDLEGYELAGSGSSGNALGDGGDRSSVNVEDFDAGENGERIVVAEVHQQEAVGGNGDVSSQGLSSLSGVLALTSAKAWNYGLFCLLLAVILVVLLIAFRKRSQAEQRETSRW